MAYYKYLTASTQIKVGISKVKGVFCSSSSSGTVAIYNEAQGGTTDVVINTFTAVAGTSYMFTGDDGGIRLDKGLYVVIGGTFTGTIIYE